MLMAPTAPLSTGVLSNSVTWQDNRARQKSRQDQMRDGAQHARDVRSIRASTNASYVYVSRKSRRINLPDHDRLTEIEARLAAATPGPWGQGALAGSGPAGYAAQQEAMDYVQQCIEASSGSWFWLVSGPHPDGGTAEICFAGNGPTSAENANLIAHAPDDLAWAVAEIRALRSRVERMREAGDAMAAATRWRSVMAEHDAAWRAAAEETPATPDPDDVDGR